ncbi:hypothetical protein ACTXGQ_15150 [Marinobacter sp. 1Y8]
MSDSIILMAGSPMSLCNAWKRLQTETCQASEAQSKRREQNSPVPNSATHNRPISG